MTPSFNRLSRDPAMRASINSIWIFAWRGHHARRTTFNSRCWNIFTLASKLQIFTLLICAGAAKLKCVSFDIRYRSKIFQSKFFLRFSAFVRRRPWNAPCQMVQYFIRIRARFARHPPPTTFWTRARKLDCKFSFRFQWILCFVGHVPSFAL